MKDDKENASPENPSGERFSGEIFPEDSVVDHPKKKHISPKIEFLIRSVLTVLAIWLILTFVAGVFVCHSDSCSPMVKDGDLCVVWKLGHPASGDVVIYSYEDQTRFGRVIAVAGDRLEIKDGTVWVNGYATAQESVENLSDGTQAVRFPYIVPDNSLFVFCDNREDIGDSRTFGAVPLDNCQGKVVFLMRRRGF